MTTELPLWVEYVRALGLPILAGLAAWIAFLQYLLSKSKRDDELFDRRYNLYEETRQRQVRQFEGEFGDAYIGQRLDLVARAEFLFGHGFAREFEKLLNPDDYGTLGESAVHDPSLVALFKKAMKQA